MTLASTIVYTRQQMLWVFSPLIVFEYSSVLDTCLAVVTEYLMKAAHRRELCLGLHFQGRQPILAGKMPGQVQEVPDHMTTAARKHRAMNAGSQLPFVILFCPRPVHATGLRMCRVGLCTSTKPMWEILHRQARGFFPPQ